MVAHIVIGMGCRPTVVVWPLIGANTLHTVLWPTVGTVKNTVEHSTTVNRSGVGRRRKTGAQARACEVPLYQSLVNRSCDCVWVRWRLSNGVWRVV